MGIIVGVDLLTGGDLFLRPSPRSLFLIGIVLVALVATRYAARAGGSLVRLVRRGPTS
jgi:hypothetical protein